MNENITADQINPPTTPQAERRLAANARLREEMQTADAANIASVRTPLIRKPRANLRIVCGFPGVGKTALSYMWPLQEQIVDLRPNDFDPDAFPANYVATIAEQAARRKLVLASAQEVVRRELVDASLAFVLVYPTRDQKADYVQRYLVRGGVYADFAAVLEREWDNMITSCEQQPVTPTCAHVVLQPGEFICMDLRLLAERVNSNDANVCTWVL